MASRYYQSKHVKELESKVTSLEKEVEELKTKAALLLQAQASHEGELKELKGSIDALKDTISKWSGGLLVAGPILTFIATYAANAYAGL